MRAGDRFRLGDWWRSTCRAVLGVQPAHRRLRGQAVSGGLLLGDAGPQRGLRGTRSFGSRTGRVAEPTERVTVQVIRVGQPSSSGRFGCAACVIRVERVLEFGTSAFLL